MQASTVHALECDDARPLTTSPTDSVPATPPPHHASSAVGRDSGGDAASSRASGGSFVSLASPPPPLDPPLPETNPDHPPLTKRELHAWYSGDFANSVFFQVVIGGYLPLLLQQMALEKAGFPDACPNYASVRGNTTLSALVFGSPMSDFFIDNAQTGKSDCTAKCVTYQGTAYCEGIPEQAIECLERDGNTRFPLHVSMGTWKIDPTEYALLFLGLSVVVQTIVFLLFGALGDFGGLRKQVYTACNWCGSLACILCIAVTPDLWWLGGLFMIVANVFFGTSVLMYNAWLPLVRRTAFCV
eukprot:m.201595 g.201595  ORF g.201595 m.201595 type:complete len:300 (+) comp21474_c0_seq1:146-1045(+)